MCQVTAPAGRPVTARVEHNKMLKGSQKQMVRRLFGGHKLLPATIQPEMRAIFVIFLILALLAVVAAGLICAAGGAAPLGAALRNYARSLGPEDAVGRSHPLEYDSYMAARRRRGGGVREGAKGIRRIDLWPCPHVSPEYVPARDDQEMNLPTDPVNARRGDMPGSAAAPTTLPVIPSSVRRPDELYAPQTKNFKGQTKDWMGIFDAIFQ